MNAILKINLLKKVIEVGTTGSYSLQKAFKLHIEWSEQTRINALANWLDPDDREASQDAVDAANKLRTFPAMTGVEETWKREVAANGRRHLTEYRWIGWLHRISADSWECLVAKREPEKEDGRLMVVSRSNPVAKPRLDEIGRAHGGTLTIDTGKSALLVEGRPVYLAVP